MKLHLQGIGKVDAIQAKDLKVGDTIMWNYGSTSKVIALTPNKTSKTLIVTTEYLDYNGDLATYDRKMTSTRLVAIV
jgi:hypothetical protein